MAAPQASASKQRRSSALCSSIVLAMILLQLAGVSAKRRGLQQEPVYCVAKPEAETEKLQEALDWACGKGPNMGSVDCKPIQEGGACFEPDTMASHASYAFTVYYAQQKSATHACDFNGIATLTYSNPSSGSCVYPTVTPLDNSSDPTSTVVSPPGILPPFGMSPAPSPSDASSHRPLCFSTASSLWCMFPLVMMLLQL